MKRVLIDSFCGVSCADLRHLCTHNHQAQLQLQKASVKQWTCDWKVAGSNPGLEGPCRTISIFSAPCAVPVFGRVYLKTKALSELPNDAGFSN